MCPAAASIALACALPAPPGEVVALHADGTPTVSLSAVCADALRAGIGRPPTGRAVVGVDDADDRRLLGLYLATAQDWGPGLPPLQALGAMPLPDPPASPFAVLVDLATQAAADPGLAADLAHEWTAPDRVRGALGRRLCGQARQAWRAGCQHRPDQPACATPPACAGPQTRVSQSP